MAEFPDINSMSYEQLQRLKREPSFEFAPWMYRQRVMTQIKNLEAQKSFGRLLDVEPLQREAERTQTRVAEEATQKGQQRAEAASRAQDIAAGRSPDTSYYVNLPVSGEGEAERPLDSSATQAITTPTPSPAAATPTPQTPPDPFQPFLDRLFQGGGGGKMPSIPRVDSKEITKNIPQISERKPEETYKADPYMTMLQTGLRILSAKPEIGQSAISQIAGGVGAGVADYRAEKEKEKQSKREEAREARTEEYRRAEAARSTAGLDMQVATLNQNASIAEARMRQEAAQHGQSDGLRRLELAVGIEDKKADRILRQQLADLRDPNQIIKMAEPYETQLESLAKQMRETKDPMQREVLKGQIARTERNIATIRGYSNTLAREDASDERNKYQMLGRLRGELTKLQGMPMADPKTVQDTIRQIRRIEEELGLQSTTAPASLPAPPR
jgi:hypothetical protein